MFRAGYTAEGAESAEVRTEEGKERVRDIGKLNILRGLRESNTKLRIRKIYTAEIGQR
jgi:hypothetical protein